VKIADWGMARGNVPKEGKFSYGKKCTLWYRSPELLYGARQYGYEVDIWSIGCIFGELKTRTPMLQGNDEQKQLDLVYRLCGSPVGACEDKLKTLPDWEKYATPKPNASRLRTQYNSSCDVHSLDLLERLLDVNPNSRITAEKALNAEYFWTDLLPQPAELPRFDSIDGTTEMAEVERMQLEYEKQKEAIKLAEDERIKRDLERKNGSGRGIGGRDGRGIGGRNSNRGGFIKAKSSSSLGPKFTIKKSTSQSQLPPTTIPPTVVNNNVIKPPPPP
jgi:serine/threonine protein kinase